MTQIERTATTSSEETNAPPADAHAVLAQGYEALAASRAEEPSAAREALRRNMARLARDG